MLAHLLPVQTCPLEHFVPHVPQFAGSTLVSTQVAPQSVVPPPQPAPHLPWEHSWPELHVVPHLPQLALSLWVSTHAPLHIVWLAPQAFEPLAVQPDETARATKRIDKSAKTAEKRPGCMGGV